MKNRSNSHGFKGGLSVGQVLVWFVVVLSFSSCSSGPGYLFPSSVESVGPTRDAPLKLQIFSEDFLADGVVGTHLIGSSTQPLRVMRGEISGALDGLLRLQMRDRAIAFQLGGHKWDLTLAGLQGGNPPIKVVVGGTVSRLKIEAVTGLSRVSTSYVISMDVECRIGLVGEGKVIKRRVRLNQKMLKFSPGKVVTEEVLDQLLREAAEQVAITIEEFIQ